jgi:hypothetical protein
VCVPQNRKEKISCHHCGQEIELSERDLRWIDTIIPHGDPPVRAPFNFKCGSCKTVFTYDYKPPVIDEKREPALKAFHVEQVACGSCQSPINIIVMSPMRTESERQAMETDLGGT